MMRPSEDILIANEQTPPKPTFKTYCQSFLFSATFGFIFSLVAGLIFSKVYALGQPIYWFVPMSLGGTLFAGFAALGATYLDYRLFFMGVVNFKVRKVVSFLIPGLIIFLMAFLTLHFLGVLRSDQILRTFSLGGILAGFIFGAVIFIIAYRQENMKQRMLMLKMRNEYLEDLAAREELIKEAARKLAVSQERNRMAQELHDSVSQGLQGIVYSLHSLKNIIGDHPGSSAIMEHLEQTSQETLSELRHLIDELSPSPLENKTLEEALKALCQMYSERMGIHIETSLNYRGTLHADREIHVYRIAQEAMANIHKHAQPDSVTLSLQKAEDTVSLIISDDGSGFDVESARQGTGHGLHNMTERAERIGGTFKIQTEPNNGCRLELVIKTGDDHGKVRP
jgi:signal transduction histidine kinase